MVDQRSLWQYAHGASAFSAALLFTAGFVCVLLWTNNIVHTSTSIADPSTSTFTYYSPTVSTFTLTYWVALFGATWNSVVLVALLLLEDEDIKLFTPRIRYELEKAVCIVAVAGNALYSAACVALMATLARIAADASMIPAGLSGSAMQELTASIADRRAGEGTTAAMAGLAAATAVWTSIMDTLHFLSSRFRENVKRETRDARENANKRA